MVTLGALGGCGGVLWAGGDLGGGLPIEVGRVGVDGVGGFSTGGGGGGIYSGSSRTWCEVSLVARTWSRFHLYSLP